MAETNVDLPSPASSSSPAQTPDGASTSAHNVIIGRGVTSHDVLPFLTDGGATVYVVDHGDYSTDTDQNVGDGEGGADHDPFRVQGYRGQEDELEATLTFTIDHFSQDGGLSHGISSTNLLEGQEDDDDEPEIVVIVGSGVSSPQAPPEPCEICLGWEEVRQRPCCSAHACTACARIHVTTQVGLGVLAVECPSCDVILTEAEVLADLDPAMKRTYQLLRRMRARAMRNSLRRGSDGSGSSSSGSDEEEGDDACAVVVGTGSPLEVDKMAAWAEEEDRVTGLANARRCPECQIYIQKRAGCYNIKCPICGSKFCYKCGERLPHDMSLHRNRNLTEHRPCIRCHGCGLCCSKLCSGIRDCCCSRRWLQVVRLSVCLLLLTLLAALVIHVSGIHL